MEIIRYVNDIHIKTFKENWREDESFAIKKLIECSISEKAQPSYAMRGFLYPIKIKILDLKESEIK